MTIFRQKNVSIHITSNGFDFATQHKPNSSVGQKINLLLGEALVFKVHPAGVICKGKVARLAALSPIPT